MTPGTTADRDIKTRILERVAMPDGEHGCWLWQQSLHRNGYGYVSIQGKHRRAHRVAYEEWVGEIGPGLDLDHLCRVRGCVNPAHLEPVSRKVNVARSPLIGFARTHCAKGHELGPPVNGARPCTTCARLATQARLEAKRAHVRGAPTHCKSGHEYTPDNLMNRSDGRRRCRACFRAWARARDGAMQVQRYSPADPMRV